MIKKFKLALHSSVIVTIMGFSNLTKADVVIKLSGGFDTQIGAYKSNAPAGYRNVSKNRENFAFNSSAHVSVNLQNALENGIIYGAKIGLEPTAHNARKTASFIYFESDGGRIELGSAKSAVATMKITCYSISCATSGGWDTWVVTDPSNEGRYKVPYVTSFSNFLDNKMRAKGKTEYPRKVTYYTPEYQGLQFGISYIPDSSNVGYQGLSEKTHHSPVSSVPYGFIVKDGIGLGLSYEGKFNDDWTVKTAVVSEHGKVKASIKEENQDNETLTLPKFNNLKAYTVGGEIIYKNISFAASYSNYMKSFTSNHDQNRSTEIYGIGGKYKSGPLGTSLNYFHSNYRKNKLHAVTLALDYKLAPGLLPYAEVTHFIAKGKRQDPTIKRDNPVVSIRGNLLLLGVKLEF